MGTHEVSNDQPLPSLRGPNSGALGCWNQQGGFMQLPGLHELTPLNSHLISPALAKAFGIPPSNTDAANGAGAAAENQQNQPQQQHPAQQSAAQFQQMQLAAQAATRQFQQMPNLMQTQGYAAVEDGNAYGQQYPAGPPSGQGYTSGMGMQPGNPQNGGASAGYPNFQHANLYGFDPANAIAHPYNLSHFQGYAQNRQTQQQQQQQHQQVTHPAWLDPAAHGMGGGNVKKSPAEEPKPTSTADDVDDNQARALKRPRLVWTPKLHQCFVDAVEQLGLKNAVPKTIMQLMHVEGLTRENVASHLQKYRLQLKKDNKLDDEGNLIGSASAGGASDELGSSHSRNEPAPEAAAASAPAAAGAQSVAGGEESAGLVPQAPPPGSPDGGPGQPAAGGSPPG